MIDIVKVWYHGALTKHMRGADYGSQTSMKVRCWIPVDHCTSKQTAGHVTKVAME